MSAAETIWARVTIPVTISIGPYAQALPEETLVRHAQECATRKIEKALGSGCVTTAPSVEIDRHGR